LINALAPANRPDRPDPDFFNVSANLPAELIVKIFKELTLSYGGAKTVPAWRLVCRAFNNIVQTRVVRLRTLTLFKWDDFNDSKTYRGVDTFGGAIGVWSLNKPSMNARFRRWYAIPPGQDKERLLGCGGFKMYKLESIYEPTKAEIKDYRTKSIRKLTAGASSLGLPAA
jgi:hypothetical protein